MTTLEKLNPASEKQGVMDEVDVDEEDLTSNPESAGGGSSSSEDIYDEDSDASIPAGPRPKQI